jgi:hypothetical protein
MSQRDLAGELRTARLTAPTEVRDRVRLIAARDTTPRPRRLTWRRAFVIALPLAAAIAATVVLTRPSSHPQAVDHGAAVQSAPAHGELRALKAPAPVPSRVQRYEASLGLRLATPARVTDAVARAQRIVTSLGGYPLSIDADTRTKSGSADLTFKVPRLKVQEALARLAALGTVTSEHVSVQDLQAGLNATEREILRLQRQLAALRAQPQSEVKAGRIAALVSRIERLQRGSADTRRTAHFATVSVHLETPLVLTQHKHHGPLHGLGVALRWIGIGAIYVLALGVPALLLAWLVWIAVRWMRRRREDALLSRT